MQLVRRVAVAVAVSAAFGLGATAQASPFLELAGGINGGGFNARIVGTGPESAYFNPGLLPLTNERFESGLFVLGDNLTIRTRPRPSGSDIAGSVYDAWLGDGQGGIRPLEQNPLATEDLQPRQPEATSGAVRTYLGVGLSKRLAEDKLVFGLFAVIPTDHVQGLQTFFSDEREQYFSNSLHFELLSDRLELMTLAFALGSRINESLSVGLGFSTGLETQANTPIFVPDGSDLGNVVLDSDMSVDFNLAPHFGVVATPWRAAKLSATLHTPSRVAISGRNEIQIANGETDLQEFEFVHGYEPLTLALGGAVETWHCADRSFEVMSTVSFRTWSSYEDRHGEAPADPWSDTFTAALGGRFVTEEKIYQVEATFVPSPVPAQTGRSNYVDNDRLGLEAGVGGVTTVFGIRVRGNFQLQAHRFFSRSATKSADAAHPVVDEFPDNAVDPTVDSTVFLPEAQGLQTNNPGYPGYSSRGWLFGAGVTLSAEI